MKAKKMALKLSISHDKIQRDADGSFSAVVWWNLLTIIFLITASVALSYAFREKKNADPVFDARPMSAPILDVVPQDIALDTWSPFDAYAPVFDSRDIFKTDEEKVLEATQHAIMNDVIGAGQWGDGYLLVGVIVDSDPRAIVQELNPPGVRTLKLGDRLGDATLIDVQDGLAVFQRQEMRVELRFEGKDPKSLLGS